MRSLLVVMMVAGVAHADLNADKDKKDADAALAEQLDTTNKACGTKLTATYDWSAEKEKPAQAGTGPGVCAEALKGVTDVCGDHPEAKKTIASKLKKLSCKFDASVPKKKPTKTGIATDVAGTPPVPHTWLELAKGTLHVQFDWHMANTRTEVANYLTKTL